MHNNNSQIVVYKASAGSGKTYVLTKEYIKLLFRNSMNFKHTLAVTFTNKACAEMKERILSALYDLSLYDSKNAEYVTDLIQEFSLTKMQIQLQARTILHGILHNYSFFYVETIDSFFQRVIRNFAKELRLNSYFGLELNVKDVLHHAIQNLFLHMADNPDLQRLLIDFSESRIDEGKSRDVIKSIENESKVLFSEKYMQKSREPRTWQQLLEAFVSIETNILLFEKSVLTIVDAIDTILQSQALEKSDFNRNFLEKIFDARKGIFELPTKSVQKKMMEPDEWMTKKSVRRADISELQQKGLHELFSQFLDLFTGETGKVYRTAKVLLSNKYTIALLQSVQREIESYCKDENLFLISNTNMFLDTIINESDAPFVYEKIGCHIKHIMIDEFQDTSSMQWKNFLPLLQNSLSEGGQSLVVGDVKQAIYRFRNGDWNLLHSQIFNDLGSFTKNVNLQYNWRSRYNVINFNNLFFQQLVPLFQQTFILKMEEESIQLTDYMTTCIESLYADLYQKTPEKCKLGGVVHIQTIDAETENMYKHGALEKVFSKVLELFSMGVKPQDIVFLARAKKEITLLVEYFNEQKHLHPQYAHMLTVLSGEALLIASSQAVQFILTYLQWIDTPECKFSKSYLLFLYMKMHMSEKQVFDVNDMSDFEHVFGTKPAIASNASLYEITEQIIYTFKLAESTSDVAFVVDFQNIVLSYMKNNFASISNFLEWWSENEKELYLKQETSGFMRAMSIHKSKGLQFSIVFIPFASWKYQISNSQVLYETQELLHDTVPVVSLSHSKKIAQTEYALQYAHEELQIMIDNLNTLYVACTRAQDALYMYVKQKNNKTEIAGNIRNAVLQISESELNHTIKDDGSFYLGVEAEIISKKSDVDFVQQYNLQYPVCNSKPILLPNPESIKFFETIYRNQVQRNYGLIMHKVFEKIETVNDVKRAVNECVHLGLIEELEVSKIEELVLKKLSNPMVQNWYNGTCRVFSEQAILTPLGEKRPDRIMLHNDIAIIVDYKFSKETRGEYTEQVSNYMIILQEMGYATKGYLWYVLRDEVQEVF